jgi:4-diphosphocytidyl-2-C-methyl-D-erythritol kinase
MTRERPDSGQPAALTLRAPAKVNLFLEVTARRADGYHELRTLLVAVSLFDALTFAPAAAVRLSCSDPTLGAGPENLVVRAADLLRRQTGTTAGAAITLTKRIPVAAGLGGGSSDAATALVGLNRLWKLGLGRDELAGLAAELGSDVAFFLRRPAAWCTGRGEVVTPWRLGRRLHLVLVCPPFGLSTADVYRRLEVPARPKSGAAVMEAVAAGDADMIGRLLFNRLQAPALALRPELADWLARLKSARPLGCLVSGSGATMFALARDAADARRVATAVRPAITAAGGRVMTARTLN